MNEIFGELRSALMTRRYQDAARELGYLREEPELAMALRYVWEHLERGLITDRPLWQSAAGAHTNPLEVLLDTPLGLAWSWGGVPFVWVGAPELERLLRVWSGGLIEETMRTWGMRHPLAHEVLVWNRLRVAEDARFASEEVEDALWELRQRIKRAGEGASLTAREQCVLMASLWVSLEQAGCAAQGVARFVSRAHGEGASHTWGWDALGADLARRLRVGILTRAFGVSVPQEQAHFASSL